MTEDKEKKVRRKKVEGLVVNDFKQREAEHLQHQAEMRQLRQHQRGTGGGPPVQPPEEPPAMDPDRHAHTWPGVNPATDLLPSKPSIGRFCFITS